MMGGCLSVEWYELGMVKNCVLELNYYYIG